MNKEKKFVSNITPRNEDFAKWYTDVVMEAKLCDYSSVKGFLIYKPNGYAIWEMIRNNLDKRFKETGVSNVYFPLLIPESLLQKEKDHIEGFAPEVAWVTKGGDSELEENLCIRPTSETLFCDQFQKEVKSYRDLPLLYNQWCSVVRWEKTTRPFLRSREFLWQEGHTVHASSKEAEDRTRMMLDIYYDFVTRDLAIPLIKGKKTDSEKFAGAKDTYTIEAMMHDGRALQSGTSHFFGDGFAKAFDIKFLNKNNKLEVVNETSWGLSTRIIGALIMVHGDDSGLILPPKIAPIQTKIIPIAMHKEGVCEKTNELLEQLKKDGIRIDADFSDKTPGFKFSEQEVLGIPTRIEIGPKDIEKSTVAIVRRDTRKKIEVSMDEVSDKLKEIFEVMQKDMYDRAKNFLDSHIYDETNIKEMKKTMKEQVGFVRAMWCGNEACEEKIKEITGAGSRCIPFNEDHLSDKCICCGKEAKHMVIWGKSY